MIVSSCRKLWCPCVEINLWETFMLICMKKSTSFLRCWKSIANLLFWELWECLTISIKIKASTWRNLIYLQAKINFIPHVFLEILQICCKLVILGTSGMTGYTHPKRYYLHHLVENFRACLQAKNQFFMLSWKYCKDIHTSHFRYFGHAWLHKPEIIVSTCRKLKFLSACQK